MYGGRLVGSGSADVITIVGPGGRRSPEPFPRWAPDVEVAVAAAKKAFDTGP